MTTNFALASTTAAIGITSRTFEDRFSDVKNVMDFGAIANGASHPLSERFASLAAAQVVYPHAASLTDEIDWAAAQKAVNYNSAPYTDYYRGVIFFPMGAYEFGTNSLHFDYTTFPDAITHISFIGAPGAKISGNFAGALIYNPLNTYVAGIVIIEGLVLYNPHALGIGIEAHNQQGLTVRNCEIRAPWRAIVNGCQTSLIESVVAQGTGRTNTGSVGFCLGNANTVLNCDISAYEHGTRHENVGYTHIGGRIEVCQIGIMLGMNPAGTVVGSTSLSIQAPSLESNRTGIYIAAGGPGEIVSHIGAAETGIEYGLRVAGGCNNIKFTVTASSTNGWSGAGISIESGTDLQFNVCSSPSWAIIGPPYSYELNLCDYEPLFSELPSIPKVGTKFTITNAATTAIGSAVTSAGATSTVTITIASPAVVSWSAHGLSANDPVKFTTTGTLAIGLVAGTTYYVKSPLTNSFNVSTTPGGAAINTTGSQSGTHTAKLSNRYVLIRGDASWIRVA